MEWLALGCVLLGVGLLLPWRSASGELLPRARGHRGVAAAAARRDRARWLRRRGPRDGSPGDGEWVAELAETTAAALQAGASLPRALEVSLAVAPARARDAAGGAAEIPGPTVLVTALAQGAPAAADRLALLRACTRLAEEQGAPAAAAISRAAELIRARETVRRSLRTLAAGPRASMGVLTALPLLGPVITGLIGLDLGQVYAGWLPLSAVLAGLVLAGLGRLWASRLLARALRERQVALANGGTAYLSDVVLALSLVALVLRSGAGLVDCLDTVAAVPECRAGPDLATVSAALRWGEPPSAAWSHVDSVWRPAAALWQVAHELGAAPALLVEAAATRIGAAEAARATEAAQRAGVHLVLPLGLCFLPAFLLTTVVPVVAHLGLQLAG